MLRRQEEETAWAAHSELRNPRKSFNNSILLLKPGQEKNEKQLTWETTSFLSFCFVLFFGEETVVLETVYHVCLLVLHGNSIRRQKQKQKNINPNKDNFRDFV